MKQTESNTFIDQLQADVRQIILSANRLMRMDPELLTTQPAEGKWSVAQVLEHLNSYGHYYLPELKKGLRSHKDPAPFFKPGFLGGYFTKMMQPKEGKVTNKMKAPKGHMPSTNSDIQPALRLFIAQQHELVELLELAKKKNINAVRIPISLSRMIKLKMGDVFAFLIAHEQRHFVQIQNVIAGLQTTTSKFQEALLVAIP